MCFRRAWWVVTGGLPAAFLLLLAAVPAAGVEASSAKEHELKAAYIFNFAKFTTWPAGRSPDMNSPLVIGILGSEKVATTLATQVKGRVVNGHPVEVRSLTPKQDFEGLHILYVGASNDGALKGLQKAFAARGLLTIGETEEFAAQGGIIRFVVEGDRLRFHINAGAAQGAELILSSQLLMLAKSVSR